MTSSDPSKESNDFVLLGKICWFNSNLAWTVRAVTPSISSSSTADAFNSIALKRRKTNYKMDHIKITEIIQTYL